MTRPRLVLNPRGMERAAGSRPAHAPSNNQVHAPSGPPRDITRDLQPNVDGPPIDLARKVLGSPEGILLRELLARHDKVAITGASGSGKSSLCSIVGRDHVIVGTDAFGFGEGTGARIASAASAHPKVIVEGVNVPRALRRGLTVTALLVLAGSHKSLNPRALGTLKSLITVMHECDRMHLMDDVEVHWVNVNDGTQGVHLSRALRLIGR